MQPAAVARHVMLLPRPGSPPDLTCRPPSATPACSSVVLAGAFPSQVVRTEHEQCGALFAFMTLTVGGLLPLSTIARFEQRDRRAAGQAAAASLPPSQREEELRRWQRGSVLRLPQLSLLEAHLACCCLFVLGSIFAAE